MNADSRWKGKLTHIGGSLNERSRLVSVTVEIDKPYTLTPKLLTGLYVDVKIHGKQLENSFAVERHWIRENSTIWVLSSEKLSIRPVKLLYHGKDKSYVKFNLSENELIITSRIDIPIDGMKLRSN
jgi:hypothetical protein